jgi:hypothetical protein
MYSSVTVYLRQHYTLNLYRYWVTQRYDTALDCVWDSDYDDQMLLLPVQHRASVKCFPVSQAYNNTEFTFVLNRL